MLTDLSKYVEDGIKLLDTKHPNWFLKIDLDSLQMHDCLKCILGQIYGEYNYGLSALNLLYGQEYRFGFNVEGFQPSVTYGKLKEEWIKQIRKRLFATPAQ